MLTGIVAAIVAFLVSWYYRRQLASERLTSCQLVLDLINAASTWKAGAKLDLEYRCEHCGRKVNPLNIKVKAPYVN